MILRHSSPQILLFAIFLLATVSGPAIAQVEWHLDRINQHGPTLDGNASFYGQGTDVPITIIASGLRTTHVSFTNRAANLFSALSGPAPTTDCNGFGTALASVAGGVTYGVAQKADLYGIFATSCAGTIDEETILRAAQWLANNPPTGGPGVVILPVSRGINWELDWAARILYDAGFTVVVPAGNENADACDYSPSRLGFSKPVIVVGASDATDSVSGDSNYGQCVNIFAPGSILKAATHVSTTGTVHINESAMAVALVAGAAALHIANTPGVNPTQVKAFLMAQATTGALVFGSGGANGSPDNLLYVSP